MTYDEYSDYLASNGVRPACCACDNCETCAVCGKAKWWCEMNKDHKFVHSDPNWRFRYDWRHWEDANEIRLAYREQ